MSKFNSICMFSLLAAAVSLTSCSERIDAGSEGILKKMWIEKWDGKLPVYGDVPQIMITK